MICADPSQIEKNTEPKIHVMIRIISCDQCKLENILCFENQRPMKCLESLKLLKYCSVPSKPGFSKSES